MSKGDGLIYTATMNPIIYAIPVFMLSILVEAWVAHRRGLKVYDIPDAITSLHHGTLSQVSGLFLKLFTFGIYVAIYTHARLFDWPAEGLLWGVAALLFSDFCYYWAHRLGHEVNILWASHVVHHSSEYYNLTTALRQTSTGHFFGWIFYIPMALAGVPPELFIIVSLIDLLYQYWVHTELIGTLGWFDRVFCSPSNHRVHHGQNDYCIDKNYGGILILWDRFFGTFTDERTGPDAEPICFGIRSPLKNYSPIWGNLHHYAQIIDTMKQTPGVLAKIGVIFSPPGGWGQPLPHFDPAGFTRFDTHTPSTLRRYVGLHYAGILLMAGHFLAAFNTLSRPCAATYAALILLTSVSLAGLLMNQPSTRSLVLRLEQLRVTALGIAFVALPDWFGATAPTGVRLIVLLVALASAVWLARQHSALISRSSLTH
jgi:alkylglycerol monooxygenase